MNPQPPPSRKFHPSLASITPLLACALLAQPATAQTTHTDGFDDPAKWTTGYQSSPSTTLTVAGGRMNFVTPVAGEEFAHGQWNVTTLPANRNWSMRVDAHLDPLPMSDPDQFVSVLLGVDWTGHEGTAGGGFNFFRHLHTNSFGIEDDFGVAGQDLPNAFYQSGLSSPDVALRMDYDGAARSFTFWFDADGAAGGYAWVAKGTLGFGPWMDQVGMGPDETFTVYITGYADQQAVANGQAWVDNLVTTIGGLAPPGVTTGNSTNLTATSATLHGTANPNGLAASAWFEYGLTTAYGTTAAVTLAPNDGTSTQDVSAVVAGLVPGQTYHYRLVASNSAGTTTGADGSFTTPVVPLPPIASSELVAPRVALVGRDVEFTIASTVFRRRYQLQHSDSLAPGSWLDVGAEWVGDGGPLVITVAREPEVPRRFFRVALDPVPEGFALIPAGEFQMGDQSSPLVGSSDELPVHTVQVSAFYIGKYEVTKEEWDAVRTWGLANGYTDLPTGGGKAANHPVHSINWYAMVKWCNARSEKGGLTPCYTVSGVTYKTGSSAPDCNWSANGYRLPTEAEWEKAARGGVSGKNFPWGTDTISHNQANFSNNGGETYQTGTTGYHPTYAVGGLPYSSPVGSFAPNGYGLCDMAGNMWERCWDWGGGSYAAGAQTDPQGSSSGSYRVSRGGGWLDGASRCRVASRGYDGPPVAYGNIGFRVARSSVP